MARIIITVNDEMKADLDKIAEKRGASLSGLVRLFVAESLAKETGKPAKVYQVEPGGNRTKK